MVRKEMILTLEKFTCNMLSPRSGRDFCRFCERLDSNCCDDLCGPNHKYNDYTFKMPRYLILYHIMYYNMLDMGAEV